MRFMIPMLVLLAGCDLFGTVRPTGRPVSEAYGGSHEVRILDGPSPLSAQRRIPILTTPEVFAVYVPSHAERDLLIGEHWNFMKLNDPEWYIERLRDPEPPANGDAPPESMRPLREMDWQRAVIPHRN